MRADGTTFPVELTITRIDVPGPPTFTGYLRDITDRKAAEAELRASRARIVEAADAARRRLERDLHDGAQQRLVELALDLRLARARLDADPDEARELLDAALDDLDKATAELRELARGIHPAALTEGGLRPALEALAGALAPSPSALVAAPEERFARGRGGRRVLRRRRGADQRRPLRRGAARRGRDRAPRTAACASRCATTAAAAPTRRAGSGLRGWPTALAALDGTLAVDSPPGGGTTLRAEIPCAS